MTQQEVIAAIRRDDKLFAEIVAGMARLVFEVEQGGGVMDEFSHKLAEILDGDEALREGCWSLREAILTGISIA